jgi:hypothetical protein
LQNLIEAQIERQEGMATTTVAKNSPKLLVNNIKIQPHEAP